MEHLRVGDSVLAAIGNTPLVELTRYAQYMKLDGRILAKCEYLNPGHSKKDRIALQIIEDAEDQSLIQPGQTVVELTSGRIIPASFKMSSNFYDIQSNTGNTGTGLAIVCGVKGYPFVCILRQEYRCVD